MNARSSLLVGAVLLCLAAGVRSVRAQVLIPNQMHRSLTFELHSVRDEVNLYADDPQFLFQMNLSPVGSMRPKIDFSNTGQAATLRVLDLSLFGSQDLASKPQPADEEEVPPEEEKPRRIPDSQSWDLRLTPAAPTVFVLRCERGKGTFDFTDMQAQDVYLTTDTTDVRIQFKRPNPVQLRRFKLTATAGSLDLDGFLNARPKLATLQVPAARCDVELTGRPFEGESEIFFEGTPETMRIIVSRSVGLRIEGPAATVARFDRDGMDRVGSALVTAGFDKRPCRLHLYFSVPIPKLEVRWED